MKGFNKTLPELWLRPELAGQEQVAGSSRQAGRQAVAHYLLGPV